MSSHFTIPPELAHLKVDERGYPIPFFVPIQKGKPNFKYQDIDKRKECLNHRKCSICGKQLDLPNAYVITGPVGLKNRVVSDAPMHLLCAEFTLAACPHIHFHKAQRKAEAQENSPIMIGKPDTLFLIEIDYWYGSEGVIRFHPVNAQEYGYENNVLVKKEA